MELSFFCIFISSAAAFTPHFITITSIEEAKSYEKKPSDSKVCKKTDEERLDICKEALDDRLLKRFKFELVDHLDIGRESLYRVQYGGMLSSNTIQEVVTACQCPSDPPIFLQDGQEEDEIIILVKPAMEPTTKHL